MGWKEQVRWRHHPWAAEKIIKGKGTRAIKYWSFKQTAALCHDWGIPFTYWRDPPEADVNYPVQKQTPWGEAVEKAIEIQEQLEAREIQRSIPFIHDRVRDGARSCVPGSADGEVLPGATR